MTDETLVIETPEHVELQRTYGDVWQKWTIGLDTRIPGILRVYQRVQAANAAKLQAGVHGVGQAGLWTGARKRSQRQNDFNERR